MKGKGKYMKKLAFIISAALLTAALPIDKAKADNPGTLMNDVNFDGVINAVDASAVLTEYCLTSSGCEPTFSKTQTFVADTDRDGTITAVDASRILSVYSGNSAGDKAPVKTVLFGIVCDRQPLNYQTFTIESAEQYIDLIREGDKQYMLIADVTMYCGKSVSKATYIVD